MSSSVAIPQLRIVFALMFCATLAHADGSVLTFSGAVSVPTCSVDNGQKPDAALAAANTPVQYFGCSGTDTTTYSASAPQAYTVSVVSLASSGLSADRLGGYYAGYMHALGASDANVLLATRAYD